MFCNQCGQANSNDAKFCSGCGVRLLNTPTQSELPQQNTKLSPLRHLWLMFLFVISVIMIIGVFPYQVITGNFKLTDNGKSFAERIKIEGNLMATEIKDLTELSKKLGISRKSLWEKRKKLDIEKKK